ncbi:hypothetical protein ACFWXA_10610 [Streptomyces atroolivaceus]|uniref:hypothetical protein n=1 Tax=Streptomyces atroolivaceus TaxID=66869 RepID=UPI00365939A7
MADPSSPALTPDHSWDARNTTADYFFTDGPAIIAIIVALADAFYEAGVAQQVVHPE